MSTATTKSRTALATVIAASLMLGACAEVGTKEGIGSIAGAALGGWAGSQIGSGEGRGIAIATGVILGGLFGNQIGKGLDKADRLEAERTGQRALEWNKSGQSSTWYNPDSGNSGSFTPKPAVQSANGQYCREYTQDITVGGRKETAYGKACRQPDGIWKIVG